MKPKMNFDPDSDQVMNDLFSTAVHEAGHIVVGDALGQRFTKAAIHGPYEGGYVYPSRRTPLAPIEECTILSAGFMASGMMKGRKFCLETSATDHELIEGILKMFFKGKSQRDLIVAHCRDQAFQILSDRWQQVMEVAGDLFVHGRLDAKQIKASLERGRIKYLEHNLKPKPRSPK